MHPNETGSGGDALAKVHLFDTLGKGEIFKDLHAKGLEAAKLLTLRAAAMKDAGMKTTLESSMAKLFASEVAVRCANEGVQIHGGYGFIKDYPAEKFYRDVKLCTIGEGTSEIQRLVIARQLLRE